MGVRLLEHIDESVAIVGLGGQRCPNVGAVRGNLCYGIIHRKILDNGSIIGYNMGGD